MSRRLIIRVSVEDDENRRNSVTAQRMLTWDDAKQAYGILPKWAFWDMMEQLRRAIGDDED